MHKRKNMIPTNNALQNVFLFLRVCDNERAEWHGGVLLFSPREGNYHREQQ